MSSIDPALAAQAAAHERHFIRRAKERFGLRISAARYREFCRRVIEVEAGVHYFGRDSAARTQWGVRFGGHVMRVVFDESTGCLVTCMPFAVKTEFGSPRDRAMKLRRLARR